MYVDRVVILLSQWAMQIEELSILLVKSKAQDLRMRGKKEQFIKNESVKRPRPVPCE